MKHWKVITAGVLGAIILAVPLFGLAVPITVPSAPGSNFLLESTSTGAYIFTQNPIVASITATSTATSSIANLEGTIDAGSFATSSSDMGYLINLAYAALPTNGGTITVPNGIWQYNVPIVFGTSGKVVTLQCSNGGGGSNTGTQLYYQPSTGNAITFNTNDYVVTGSGITNCYIKGTNGTTARTSVGVLAGGSNGAFSLTLTNDTIRGFGTGFEFYQNNSFNTFINTVLNFNGTNISQPTETGANGENFKMFGGVVADGNNQTGGATDLYCINFQLSGNVQNSFYGTSFDDCSVYLNQSGGTANVTTFTGVHWENPNGHSYPYIQTLTNVPATEVKVIGGDMMNDDTSGMPEYILDGGDLNLEGVTFDSNSNVSVPVTAIAVFDNTNNNATMSWTGLTSNGKGATYMYGTTPFSPAGYGTGLAIQPTFSVGLANTQNGTTTIANFAGILSANSFASSTGDIGSDINAAYAALPAKGGIITVSNGVYSFSTPIVCGTNGKRCLIEGAPGGATELDYTGSATSTTINDGIQSAGVDHSSGNGIYGITLKGNNTSTTSPQVGVQVGGSNGTDGAVLNSVNIEGFGQGLVGSANLYHFLLENSTIRNNGQNVYFSVANNSGEGLNFQNDFIVDAANSDPINCFYADNFAATEITVTGGSFDDCAVYLGFQITSATFTGVNWENPNYTAYGAYNYLTIANSAYGNTLLNGGTFLNDAPTSASTTNSFIVANQSTLELNGVTAFKNGNVVATMVTGTGNVSWTDFNNTAGAVTNIINTSGTPQNGTTGTFQLSALGTPAGTFLAADPKGNIIATTSPSGGSGTVLTGTTGQFPYYASSGTTLTATSSIFVTTASNVGIATTTPAALLDDYGSFALPYGSPIMTDNRYTTNNNILTTSFVSPNDSTSLWTPGNTSGDQIAKFTVLSNGNAGVGTTSPFALLTVATPAGATGATTNLFLVASSTATATTTLFSISNTGTMKINDPFGTNLLTLNTASTSGPIFAVDATTTGNPTLFSEDQYGHLTASSTGATPTIGTCGTGSPAMGANANDAVGSFTTGTSASACTITFAHAYSSTPIVVISDSNTSAVIDVSSISTTAFTVSLASALSAATVYYMVEMP